MNYLSEQELNSVKGLMHYLNENMPPTEGLASEVRLIDANGEFAGRVTWSGPDAGYVFTLSEGGE